MKHNTDSIILVYFGTGRLSSWSISWWSTTYLGQVLAKFKAHWPCFGSSLQCGNLQQTERLSKCQWWTMWSNWRKWNIRMACNGGKFKRAAQALETVSTLTWKFLFNCKCHVVGLERLIKTLQEARSSELARQAFDGPGSLRAHPELMAWSDHIGAGPGGAERYRTP